MDKGASLTVARLSPEAVMPPQRVAHLTEAETRRGCQTARCARTDHNDRGSSTENNNQYRTRNRASLGDDDNKLHYNYDW